MRDRAFGRRDAYFLVVYDEAKPEPPEPRLEDTLPSVAVVLEVDESAFARFPLRESAHHAEQGELTRLTLVEGGDAVGVPYSTELG